MTKPTNYRHPQPRAKVAILGKGAVFLTAPLVLSACGGGGGGTADPSAPPTLSIQTLTDWNAVQPGSTVEGLGLGKRVSYDYANQQISKIYNFQDTSASVLFGFDSSGKLTGLFPTSSISFSGNEITVLGPDFVAAEDATSVAVVSNPQVSNPAARAWDYQSFGFWETGLDQDSRTFGVFSVGGPTQNSVVSIPGVDGATFTGKVVGGYVSTGGLGHTVLADLIVTANFSSSVPSLAFSTTTTLISSEWGSFEPHPTLVPGDLNLSGELTLTGNTFSGNLTTASGLEGNSTGQFYGPNAEELGGVFFLRDPTDPTSLESYAGAYGASRPLP